MASTSVSVIGLGGMGSAIARVLVANGVKTTVWNRTQSKAESLAQAGASVAASARECIMANELVITCVSGATAVCDLLRDLKPQSCHGRVLLDYSAGSLEETAHLIEQTQRVAFSGLIRGAILTYPSYVGTPESKWYYSGHKPGFDPALPILKILGNPKWLGDDPTFAAIQEHVIVNIFFSLAAGFVQSMALYKRTKMYGPGAAERLLVEEILPMMGYDFAALLDGYAKQIDAREYTVQGEGAPLALLQESFAHMMMGQEEQGVKSMFLGKVLEKIKERVAQGGGQEEFSALVETL